MIPARTNGERQNAPSLINYAPNIITYSKILDLASFILRLSSRVTVISHNDIKV